MTGCSKNEDSIEKFSAEALFTDYDDDPLPIPSSDGEAGVSEKATGLDIGEYEGLLCPAFAYTLSRFTGSTLSVFSFSADDSLFPAIAVCSDSDMGVFLRRTEGLLSECRKFSLEDANRMNGNLARIGSVIFGKIIDQKHELCLSYSAVDNEIILRLSHSDRYSDRFAERFLDVLCNIIRGMKGCRRLSEIQYTPESDLEMLDDVNATETEQEYDDIIDAIKEHVNDDPNGCALRYLDRIYTNSEMYSIMGGIASNLTELGAANGDPIAVFVRRSEWLALAPLAVLRAGCAFVPLDEELPDERIIVITDIIRPKAIVTVSELSKKIANLCPEIPLIIADRTAPSDDYINPHYDLSDNGYLVFTSGTTGVPKGVVHNRHIFLNMGLNYSRSYDLKEDSVISLFTALGFALHLDPFYAAIYAGRCLDVMPESVRKDIPAMCGYFKEHRITHTAVTPSIAKSILMFAKDVPIEHIFMGGEQVGVIETGDLTKLNVDYGCSECCSIATVPLVRRPTSASVGKVCINTKVYILDAEGRRVPIGACGTLHISGNDILSEYLGNRELTDEKIVPNIFDGDEPGYEMMFNNGDSAVMTDESMLSILGRKDGMVKIRGNRVELTEIESLLRTAECVKDVTVQTVRIKGDMQEIAAYIVTDDRGFDYKGLVGSKKPEYMVPSYVIFIDSVPLNINGKVDRRRLPLPDRDTMRPAYRAPQTDDERRVCDVFGKVLGIDNFGMDDDFVALGGSSLNAINAQARIHDLTSVKKILGLRTPAAIIDDRKNCGDMVNPYTAETGCPLTGDQNTMYMDMMVNSKGTAYNMDFRFGFDGYAAEDIRAALEKVIEAHPVLKARIETRGNVQWIVCDSYPDIQAVKEHPGLKALTEPFDLFKGPICRFRICDDGTLFGCINHLVFDGMSIGILEKEMRSVLEGNEAFCEDGFTKVAAFEEYHRDKESWKDAERFFDGMFGGYDDDSHPVASPGGKGGCSYRRLKSDIPELERRFGIPSYPILVAAFAYTLSRFSGRSEAVFCTVNNGRSFDDLSRSFGMFAKTLPERIDCTDDSISSYLNKVNDSLKGVEMNDMYPFRNIAERYDIRSDIVFQYRANLIAKPTEFDNGMIFDRQRVNDILACVYLSDDGLEIGVEHSPMYSDEFADRFAESYDMILNAFMSCERLSDIQFVSEKDTAMMDSVFRRKGESYPDIMDAFVHDVETDPDRDMLRMGDDSHTFRECSEMIGALVKHISRIGVKEGEFIGLTIPCSVWYSLAPLGVLASGCAYVFLDPKYPDERISEMIESCSIRAILTTGEFKDRLASLTDTPLIILNEDDRATFAYRGVGSDTPAFIIYTSGTTGRPKIVVHRRRDIILCADAYIDILHIDRESVPSMFSGLGFVAHITQLYPHIVLGITLDIVPAEERSDLNRFSEYADSHGITHVNMITSIARLFLSSRKSKIKYINIGGEPIGTFPEGIRKGLVVTYGSSEGMQTLCGMDVDQRIYDSSVGFPASNVKVYILDSERRRLPIGSFGHIYISGPQLTAGYLNNEELNERVFIRNPFDDDPDFSRIFDTGDVGFILPDGSIGIAGRLDLQVKIRGNRVELTDVESAIRSDERIKSVTVQAAEVKGSRVLVAYVVKDDGIKMDAQDVKDLVAEKKPAYMVPSYVEFLDAIPLNSNGKVDRRALPAPNTEIDRAEYTAPRNRTERELCETFSKILEADDVGIDDNFISLGGDSLKAIAVRSMLSSSVSTADILKLCTPRRIAEASVSSDIDLGRYTLGTGCPLTESQLNIYLDHVVNSKRTAYNNYLTVEIDDISKEEAMALVISLSEAYPVLRCRIEDADVPRMVCDVDPGTLICDVRELREPFDLSRQMCRFVLTETEDGIRIDGSIHHVINDGMSRNIICRALSSRDMPETPDLGFLRAAAFEDHLKNDDYMKDAREFFDREFSSADVDTGLLSDFGGKHGLYTKSLTVRKSELEAFVHRNGLSNGVFMTSVFAYALSRQTGRSDAVFCAIDNGRDHGDIDTSAGMFVRTLPVCIDCSDRSVDEFLQASSSKIFETMRYGSYPFRRISKDYGVRSDITFQYLAGLVDIPVDGIAEGETELSSDDSGLNCEISMDVLSSGDSLFLSTFHSDRYSEHTVERICYAYDRILSAIVSGSAERLSDIDYISSADIEAEGICNDTAADIRYGDIIEAFRTSVKDHPDSPYVTYKGRTVSYGEADRLTDSVAAAILRAGAGKGDSVSSFVSRSEWYALSIIAITKAGCVYVPIDETYPDDRIGFMIEDSSSKIILVTPENLERAERLTDATVIDVTASGYEGFEYTVPSPEDISMILYTSGTTGQPKGALIPHRAVSNFAEWYVSYTGSDKNDRFAMYASYGFDAHMIPICAALYSGGCLDIIPEDVRLDMTALNEHIISRGITELFLPTSVGKIYVRTQRNSRLRHLMIGGEPSGDITTDQQYTLIDGYGPTENFIFTCVSDTKDRYPSSVGRPLINNKVYILDKEGRRVQFGAVGELYIAGYQVAECYLNRPDMNAKAFSENRYSDDPSFGTLYSTGDYARLLPDYTVQILGRRDGQVKIRGNRVELTEVESVILSMDGIDKVSVQAIVNTNGGKEICAYAVMKDGHEFDGQKIKSFVLDRKPAYMVPSYVIRMDDIPLNVNGKVNRRELPMPSFADNEYVAPRNRIERLICDAFADVLNIDEVSIDTDFSAFGGDSIKAINVVSFCRSAGLRISAQDVIGRRMPRLIADTAEAAEYNCEEVTGTCPLPPTLRMFSENVQKKGTFDQCMILESDDRIDMNRMQRALDKVIGHHDMLRASFGDVLTIPSANGSVCRISEYEADDPDSVERMIVEIRKCSDIYDGRMVSCGIIRTKEKDLLVISINHTVVDAVSWRIILDDLLDIYTAEDIDSYRMPSKTMSYPEWVGNLCSYTDTNRTEHDYWKKVSGNIADHVKGRDVIAFTKDTEIDLTELSSNPYCAKTDEILIAAYARAYSKILSERSVSIAMEGHGRAPCLGDVSRTVGWFTCIYPTSLEDIGGNIDDDIWKVIRTYRGVPNGGVGYGAFRYADGSDIEGYLPAASFNYLSDAMAYSGKGFRSYGKISILDDSFNDLIVHGISLNVFSKDGRMSILCYCDKDTEYGDCAQRIVDEFIAQTISISEHITEKMKKRDISCGLSLAALNVLLDESKSDMGNAYNSPNFLRLPDGATVDSARRAVEKVIHAHPSLKIRVSYGTDEPYFICDSDPEIKIVTGEPDMEEFNRKFDFHRSVSRFWIVDRDGEITVMSNVHHLAIDNYSVGNLRNDLLSAYEGKDIPLDLGFVISANQNISSKDSPEYLDSIVFFRNMFSDADTDSAPIPDSWAERPCDAMRSISIPKERIDRFIKDKGITASGLFTAGFAYAISRQTSRNDSIFCFMENGRNTRDLERAIGMFAKILPIRIDCSDKSVDDFIRDVSSTMIDVIAHDSFPFYEAAKMFNVNGSIQFQFVPSQNFLETFESLGDRDYVLTDLDFNILVNGDEYVMYLLCSSKYSKETADRFLDTYEAIIEGFLEKERLSEIDYISDRDRKLIDGYNDTARPLRHRTILESFRECVEDCPDNTAVVYGDTRISYAEADRLTDSIASRIMKAGIGKGHMIAVFVPRSEWYVLAPLSVIKTGAAYVPVDTSYPDERAIHMIADSGSSMVLTLDETDARARSLGVDAEIMNLSMINMDDSKVDVSIDTMDPCVILYTSGTTGKPKGSVITHRAVVNMCEWYIDFTKMTSEDCYGFYTSIAFDIHTMALFAPMVCAASIDVVPEEVRLDMERLNDHYVKNNVTHTFITTQVGKLFASSGFDTTIKFLLYGGEKLGIFSAPDSIGACESYGPSENLSLSTAIYVNDRKDPSSVGHLLPNIKAYVLDPEKRMVPIGAVGELFLTGFQLSTGYLNREELNSKVFVRNPYSDDADYIRIYATGDYFRWLPDGTLGVIGRRDGQLKIRGNRVELTEVDEVIRQYPGVKDVTVQPIVNDTGGKELCAYIVSDSTNDLIAEDIKKYVSERKPAYMVPAYVVFLDAIPLTVNAKVDKRALPKPDVSVLRAEYVAPRNEKERLLSDAFSSVLNVENIGIDDDFIQLGGDSIKAIRLIPVLHSEEMEEMGITPADVIALRTIRSIMAKIFTSVKIPELYNYSTGCPLTDSQRSFYEYAERNPDFWYNLPMRIDIRATTSVKDIRRKLTALRIYYPATTSRISVINGEPRLFFDIEPDIPILNVDPEEYEKEFVRRFALNDEPLCRYTLVEWEGRTSLFFDIHHLLFDGMSIPTLINAMLKVRDGERILMDDGILRVSAYDSVMKGTERYKRSKAIAESAIIGSCTDYLPKVQSDHSNSITRKFTSDGDSIRGYASKNGSSIAGFMSAVLGCAFSRISGKNRCLFFLTEDGRGHMNLEDSICLYAKGVPVSADVLGKDHDTILKEVSEHVFQNMSYDEYAVWEMMHDHGVEWNIRLQYAGFYMMDELAYADQIINLRDINTEITDLWIMVREDDDGFSATIIRSKIFSDEQIEMIFKTMDDLIIEFITGDGRKIIGD